MAASELILLVEDEPIVLLSTADLLRDAGFEVLQAANGTEALSLLEERPETAALVTDIDMPGGSDGLSLAWTVAERWPQTRILIVSGKQRPKNGDYPEKAIFFTKPYAPGALVTMVQQSAPAGG